MISYENFQSLDIRIAKILTCEEVPKTKNLLKMTIDCGNLGEDEPRTIVSGIKNWYSTEDLIGKFIVVILNLQPRTIRGIKSTAMLLAADVDETAVLLQADAKFADKLKPGQKIS